MNDIALRHAAASGQAHRMARLVTIVLLITASAFALGADAPERERSPAETAAPPSAASQPDAKENGKRRGTAQGDVFLPTEEISEDFAVSFPVDI